MNDFKKNRCLFCNKVFCCVQCLTKHETITHCSECQICVHGKLVFRDYMVTMIEHIELVHLPLHCVLCKKIFNNIEEVRVHRPCPADNDGKIKFSEYDSPPISDFKKNLFMDCEKITPSLLHKNVITTSTPLSGEDAQNNLPSILVNFSADSNKESIISDSSLTNIIKTDQSRLKPDTCYHITLSGTPEIKSKDNDQVSFELHQSSLNICSIDNSGKKERPILEHTKPLGEANYNSSLTMAGKESIIIGSCYVKKVTSEVTATTSTPISRSEKYLDNNSEDTTKVMPTQQIIYKIKANENQNPKKVVPVVTPGLETCNNRQPLQDKFMEEDISHINKVLATPENNIAISNMKNLSEAPTQYFTARKEFLTITYKESEFTNDTTVTEPIVEEFDVNVTVPNPDNTLWISAMNEQKTIPDKKENNTNLQAILKYARTENNKASNNMCGMFTSFTQMVKEFVFSGPSSSATSFKRVAEEPLDNGYNYKRMKINDIKCRPTIRRICPVTHLPVIMVDKETQTD